MRELNVNEIKEVSGGIAPLLVIVIRALMIAYSPALIGDAN
jgi:lactobin A/cerein 7B family class IIb bacteriocin